MKTYKCEYYEWIDGIWVSEKIQAESHREAYEKFLASQGVFPKSVIVRSGFTDEGTIFDDHVKSARAASVQAIAIKQTATEDAEASLTSTDVLLKQLIAKQDETNQWLKAIRWTLAGIGIMLAIWNIRVFG